MGPCHPRRRLPPELLRSIPNVGIDAVEGQIASAMPEPTDAETWWDNLSAEAQDRLAEDPGGSVPEDLRSEVAAADTDPRGLRSPFVGPDDWHLRGTMRHLVDEENLSLLARLAKRAPDAPAPPGDELKARARRRGLIS